MHSSTDRYTGDVTLSGTLDTPVSMQAPDDVFVLPDGVSDRLQIHNPEAVFTHTPIEGETASIEPAATVSGALEDGYVEPDGVTGSLLVADGEDVFIPATGTSELTVTGAESTYTDADVELQPPTEATTTGWRQTDTVRDPTDGVTVAGANHSITVTDATGEITVYVVGYGHDIEITDSSATVSIAVVGYDNSIGIGPRCSVGRTELTGFDNEIEDAPFPVEDLIETTKREACQAAGFGRSKITYQQPATDEQWCQNCGHDASAVIERHQLDGWFLFGVPIKVFGKSMNPAQECEHCAITAGSADLTEAERTDLFR